MTDAEMVRKNLEFLKTPDNVVAFRLKNNANGDSWRDIVVILNSNKTSKTITIPDGTWTSVCDGGQINLAGISEYRGSEIEVAPQEALILYNK